jgi:hypothetical protein
MRRMEKKKKRKKKQNNKKNNNNSKKWRTFNCFFCVKIWMQKYSAV